MEAVDKVTQQKAVQKDSEFEQGSEFQGQESAQLFADPDDAAQRRAIQAAASNSEQVQQLMALQRAVGQSQHVQATAQLKAAAQQFVADSKQAKAAENGLPAQLKAGIEQLSGFSMDDVKVHRNSSKPAEVGALAYALGTDIYLASGQEAHLPHEAWHVVQQKQGRVKPTTQAENGASINDDAGLEQEADRMGAKAMQMTGGDTAAPIKEASADGGSIQRMPTKITDPTDLNDGLHFDKKGKTTAGGKQVPSHVIGVVKKPTMGTKPSISTPGWDWLQNRVEKMKGRWVRFHLINENLGGPGHEDYNLVPTSVAVNNEYERSIETHAKKSAKHTWTYVEVKMSYDTYPEIPVPQTITAEYGVWDSDKSKWKSKKEDTFHNPELGEVASGFSYKRGSGITNSQLSNTSRKVPSGNKAKEFRQWLQKYRQVDQGDEEMNEEMFGRAAEKKFEGEAYGWIKDIWLEESIEDEDLLQPVLKALPITRKYVPKKRVKKKDMKKKEETSPKKRKRNSSSSSGHGKNKKRNILEEDDDD